MTNDKTEDCPRTAEEVATRIIALQCVIAAAHGVPKSDVIEWLNKEELTAELTPKEKAYLFADDSTATETARMTWFAEAEMLLLWAVQLVDTLEEPGKLCDTGKIIEVMPGLFESTKAFIGSATLRSEDEIEKLYEKTYDIHCEIGKAKRDGHLDNMMWNKDVVFFRHYALNWLTGYCCQEWDEVTPDI